MVRAPDGGDEIEESKQGNPLAQLPTARDDAIRKAINEIGIKPKHGMFRSWQK